MSDYRFCPRCASTLIERADADADGGRLRRACPDHVCGYVHWDNPLPFVALAPLAVEASHASEERT